MCSGSLGSMCMVWANSSKEPFSSSQSGDTGRTEGCPPLILHGKEPSVAFLVRPGNNLCGLPCGSQSLSGCCMLSLCLQPDILDQCSAHLWCLGSSGDLVSSFSAAAGLYPSSLQSISTYFFVPIPNRF